MRERKAQEKKKTSSLLLDCARGVRTSWIPSSRSSSLVENSSESELAGVPGRCLRLFVVEGVVLFSLFFCCCCCFPFPFLAFCLARLGFFLSVFRPARTAADPASTDVAGRWS